MMKQFKVTEFRKSGVNTDTIYQSNFFLSIDMDQVVTWTGDFGSSLSSIDWKSQSLALCVSDSEIWFKVTNI